MPSRRQRNQAPSRVHDIEFATEISTSLLAQVRQLQSLLADRDEALKNLNLEKNRLELEAEGFNQRLQTLDESEQRYKDENWSLETQTHELMASLKESADREKKLTSQLNALAAEKNDSQRQLDELKQSNGQLQDEHSAAQKAHDSELHILRRNITTGESEKFILQRKIEEITAQNQELAKAVAAGFRQHEEMITRDRSAERERIEDSDSTPDNSPPISPNKPTPRHGHLESETLKSSLYHAHRMIQNLKSNIHREKTDKIELKRMLQETRDELEIARLDQKAGPAGAKRQKNNKQDVFKKPARPNMLGAGRRSRMEVEDEEFDWEDQLGEPSPSKLPASRQLFGSFGDNSSRATDASDAYQTANETEGFETANEKDTTDSEAFQTGQESMAEDTAGEDTETEARNGTVRANLARGKRPTLNFNNDREAYLSTASTSAGEEEDSDAVMTPIQAQMPKYRLKVNRGRVSRSRQATGNFSGSESSARNSPSTTLRTGRSPPRAVSQSLFAELGELESANSDSDFGTPVRDASASLQSTPGAAAALADSPMPASSALMVDSGTMTEPWSPSGTSVAGIASAGLAGAAVGAVAEAAISQSPDSTATATPTQAQTPTREFTETATQYTPLFKNLQDTPRSAVSNFPTPPKTVWDESVEAEARAAPVPVVLGVSDIFSQETEPVVLPEPESKAPVELSTTSIQMQETEPVHIPVPEPKAPLELSTTSIQTLETEPIHPVEKAPVPPPTLGLTRVQTYHSITPVDPPTPKAPAELTTTSIQTLETQPIHTVEKEAVLPPALALSSIQSIHDVTPVDPPMPKAKVLPPLSVSGIHAQETQPVSPPTPPKKAVAPLTLTGIHMQETEPVSPATPPPKVMPVFARSSIHAMETQPISPATPPAKVVPILARSSIHVQETQPVSAPEPRPKPIIALSQSNIHAQETQPIASPAKEAKAIPVLGFSSVETVQEDEPVAPATPKAKLLPALSFADVQTQETEPVIPETPKTARKAVADLSVTRVLTAETTPVEPAHVPEPVKPTMVDSGCDAKPMEGASRTAIGAAEIAGAAATGGVLGSVFGWNKGKASKQAVVAEDETAGPVNGDKEASEASSPLKDLSNNIQKPTKSKTEKTSAYVENGAQTILGAEQIDNLMVERNQASAEESTPKAMFPRRLSVSTGPRLPTARSQVSDTGSPVKSYFDTRARPSTANSQNLPPLPSDHKEMIAAASRRTSDATSMPPPLMPASALRPASSQRAPHTPGERPSSPYKAKQASLAPASPSQLPSRGPSRISRRSSVTSFASEIEERFNINVSGLPSGIAPGTDPRMIQAITQTMIGEYLWKYTRKSGGRKEFSATRHRRYFWVHPYTRTLYWSDQDPQRANKPELKAKSVQIEAVRVVKDENPLPPGLHQKSIEIITAGRTIKFTASTGQRHETWFNALSYLVLRNQELDDPHSAVISDDVSDFSPTLHRERERQPRPSLSSYNSRGTRNTSQSRAGSALSQRPPVSPLMTQQQRTPGSASYRVSKMLSSFSSRRGRYANGTLDAGSIYDASVVENESAEDLRRVIEEQEAEQADRLENVRACCDGKHDVGSLPRMRTSRHASWTHRHPSHTHSHR